MALYGSLAGDIAGSTFEFIGVTGNEDLFPEGSTFTDDSVLTLAVADAIMSGSTMADAIRTYATLFPVVKGGYGDRFVNWLIEGEGAPAYNSCGNGSAMRCCACGWAADTLEETLELARQSAECTHNHPEGIKGAQATAAVIFMARNGKTKEEIKDYVHKHFYDMSKSYEDLYNEDYSFHKICQETVPRAIISFLNSYDFESAILMSMLVDKDTDTIGAIAGSMAEAFYGVPEHIKQKVRDTLDARLLDVLDEFEKAYGIT